MRFNEFEAGMTVFAGRRHVTEEEIVEFAKVYDPQKFHTDAVWARDSRWGGLISSGWMTCSIAMRLIYDNVLHDSGCIGSPGLEYLKWPNPLRPSDEVELNLEVLEKRVSRSGAMGILRWRWVLSTQKDQPVLDVVVTNFFDLKSL